MSEVTGSQAERATNTDRRRKQPVLRTIIHHPLTGWVIGIAASLYIYRLGVMERCLTYYISPTRTPITQLGSNNLFSVQIAGHPIGGDLSSMQIQIWNAGRQSIRQQDILQPITISSEHNVPIYVPSFILSRAQEINGITSYQTNLVRVGDVLVSTNQQGLTNAISQFMVGTKLIINWNILEKNKDAFKINIIYGGRINEKFKLEGVIEGPNSIKLYEQAGDYLIKLYNVLGILIIVGFCFYCLLYLNRYAQNRKWLKEIKWLQPLIKFCFLGTILIYLAFFGIPLYHALFDDKPPLGF